MSEQLYDAPRSSGCPSWCAIGETGQASHGHRSEVAESPGTGLTARLVQVSADDEPRIMISGDAVTAGAGRAFAGALLRLVDQATLAPSGLDLVITLARGRVTLDEMAVAAGLDVERLRDQHAGGQVLSVHDMDRLALIVARLIVEREDQARGPGPSLIVA
jgi:hypothetical protein